MEIQCGVLPGSTFFSTQGRAVPDSFLTADLIVSLLAYLTELFLFVYLFVFAVIASCITIVFVPQFGACLIAQCLEPQGKFGPWNCPFSMEVSESNIRPSNKDRLKEGEKNM